MSNLGTGSAVFIEGQYTKPTKQRPKNGGRRATPLDSLDQHPPTTDVEAKALDPKTPEVLGHRDTEVQRY